MKILILIESLKIDQHSAAIVGSNYINALESTGNKVHVLYPDEIIEDMPNPEPTWLNKDVTLERFSIVPETTYAKIINKIPKLRAYPSYLYGANFSKQRWIRSWKIAIQQHLELKKYDIIIALGVGAVFAPHFAMEEVQTDIPWMAYVHDPFPQQHYPDPYRKDTDGRREAEYKRFDRVMKKANIVGFPSLRLKEWMQAFHPSLENNALVSPHVEYEDRYLPKVEAQSNLDPTKFNLLHAGSLLGERNPDYLISAFRRFVESSTEIKDNVHLHIIGSISEKYNALVSDENSNIHINKKRISYTDSLSVLKQSDVLVIIEADAEDSPFMPGKLTDYIKSDKPILAMTPLKSETTRLLGKDYAYLTKVDDEEKILEHLKSLWIEHKENRLSGLNRPDLVDYVSKNNLNKILHEALSK